MAVKDWKRWAVLFVWLLVLFISLRAHTPWRDEYQSWLISTRADSTQDFMEAIRYERHPPLHYILQRTLVTLVPQVLDLRPSTAIQTVTVPFTIGAALLLLFAVGLPAGSAALLLFSPYFLREFGVISRSYALGLFFLLAAVALGQRKKFSLAYATLAIGALTHLLFSWVCGSIFVLLAIQDRRRFRDPHFWLSGAILIGAALLQLPPPDGVFPSVPNFEPKTFWLTLRYLNQSLWGVEKIWEAYRWNTMPLATEMTAILLAPALWMIYRALDLRKFLWVCVPPLLLVAASSSMNLRTLGVSFFGFVACYLLFKKDGNRTLNPLVVFSLTGILSTALWWLTWAPFDLKPRFQFSGTKEMMIAMQGKIEIGVLLVGDEPGFFTWMAETKSNVFDVRRNKILRYPLFKKSEYIYAHANAWCAEKLNDFKRDNAGKEIFFGQWGTAPFPEKCGRHEKVFANQDRILTDENFEVYLLKD